MADHGTRIIVTCAVTGGIHTPTMSAALPGGSPRHRRTE